MRGQDSKRRWARLAVVATLMMAVTSVHGGSPDFSHTRPKGKRLRPEPLPEKRPVPPKVRYGTFRPLNEIDQFILKRLQDEKVRPNDPCNDWDFARRTSLDLVGIIPRVEDLDRFFRWKKKKRRDKWIDLLLAQKQYADHWTTFWGDLLRERGRVRGLPENALKNVLHQNLLDNRPFDDWVRELMTAEGPAEENPASGFILQDRVHANTLTVSISEVFLGVQIRCAECHDHPFDWWTQKDFQGMAGFWDGTRVRRRAEMQDAKDGARRRPLLEVVTNSRRSRGVFLTGAQSDLGQGPLGLADLITRRDNPYFARVAVNRLWQKLMGRGLVNPPSNFSALNPPSHPDLLDWLAIEFVDSGYDLKHILRLIVSSRTYQQTSSEPKKRRSRSTSSKKTPEENDPVEGSLFESVVLRRMTAEQIYDSVLAATGHYDSGGRFRPSIELTYPPRDRSFLRTFGASDRQTIQSPPLNGSIQQTLTLLNGRFLNGTVRWHPDHPLQQWRHARGLNVGQLVDALFYQILTRPPTKQERRGALQYVGNGGFDEAWEDLQWALFNSREFQFIR
ncbi:MAG: DUF1549 and DUF1553 domain-containing protein [Phycisphaerales bacterium]|nr:DUF1549 and DUF1553 domain-containing protein [Phycisphaerales bacterium]